MKLIDILKTHGVGTIIKYTHGRFKILSIDAEHKLLDVIYLEANGDDWFKDRKGSVYFGELPRDKYLNDYEVDND